MDMNIQIQILYPEIKCVTVTKIMGWAKDCFLNKETNTDPKTLAEAVAILEDLGHITFHKSIDAILDSPEAYEILG